MLLIPFFFFCACLRVCDVDNRWMRIEIGSMYNCHIDRSKFSISMWSTQTIFVQFSSNSWIQYLVQRPDQLPLIVIKSDQMNWNNKRIPFWFNEFEDDWWVNSMWLWLWCVENDISHWIIWCIANTRWWIYGHSIICISNLILIIWLSAQFLNIIMLLLLSLHTSQNFTCWFVLFLNYFIEKEKKTWQMAKKYYGTNSFAFATHFDLIHQIRFLKLNVKIIKTKSKWDVMKREATSLFSWSRKTVQHNVCVIMDRF